MNDINQPTLPIVEEPSRFDRFKKSIRKPYKSEVALFATITGVFASGVIIGGCVMNDAWKSEIKKLYNEYEDAGV